MTTLPLWQRLLKHASSITIEKVLHLPRQLSAVNLDIDLKVADRTQPVQVSSTQRDPLTINRARLRMQHCVSVAKDANTPFKALSKVPACQPICHDMIGVPGNQDPHVYTSCGCRLQRFQQDMIGYKIGIGQQDRVLSAVDSLDIHIAYRKSQPERIVTAYSDERIKVAHVMPRNLFSLPTRPVPEADKRMREISCRWPPYTQVRISPLGCVEVPQIKAPNKSYGTIHHQ